MVPMVRTILYLIFCGLVIPKADAQQFGYSVNNQTELDKAMKLLREKYAPFLVSMNTPVEVRKKHLINEGWVSKYEIENATDTLVPKTPLWYMPETDIREWKKVSIPEWRYSTPNPEAGTHHRNPGNRIVWYRTETFAGKPARGKRVFLVFDGADWLAEVYFNGKFLGSHTEYFESFRFDVTDLIKPKNNIAVRIIDGYKFGEQAAFWSLFPVVPACEQLYVKDRIKSIAGFTKGDLHIGNGYGINGDVYFETTAEWAIENVLARANRQMDSVKVKFNLDSKTDKNLTCEVHINPENFHGETYITSQSINTREKVFEFNIPAKNPKLWDTDQPYLYLCRIILKDQGNIVDARDVLFGFRTFEMVSEKYPRGQLKPGTFLLNDKQTFLRGTNIQGLNPLIFWGEKEKALDILLMVKAANFNFIRSCQHVQFKEVRELQDRLGIMSMQEKGSRYPQFGKRTQPYLISAIEKLTKEVYNNPGVVMLSFANEMENFTDCSAEIEAVLKIDKERIVNPVSGIKHSGEYAVAPGTHYNITQDLYSKVIEDVHEYPGWYKFNEQPWKYCRIIETNRLVLKGEYGAEAIDSYHTMVTGYPQEWGKVPEPSADTLIGNVQCVKGSKRMFLGFNGKYPENLQENIVASQNYQAYILDETTKGYRVSPSHVTGYFQFHFIDVMPANWPKSIVSHDLTPKTGYYAMAQVNQPVVALPVMSELKDEIDLFVANDLNHEFPNGRIRWDISIEGNSVICDSVVTNIKACTATRAASVSIGKLIPKDTNAITIRLTIYDAGGNFISKYERPVFIKAWRYKDRIFSLN
jgi:beta-mannosidase